MGVEQGATKGLALDGGKRVADRARGARDGDARVLERGDNIKGDEKLVLNHENGLCGHYSFTFPSFAVPASHEMGARFVAGRRCAPPPVLLERRQGLARFTCLCERSTSPVGRQEREYNFMNWDRIEGNWKQFSGKAQQQWGKLTNDDLDVVEGRRVELVGRIQERYGIAKDEAEKQVDTWLQNM